MSLRTPPLGGHHADRGAKLTEFGGWEMPVEFDSIRAEHEAVRAAAGKFDVSHMGEIEVSGPDAAELMNRLTTNDVGALAPGDAQYSAITDENGVMLDDTVVYRLPDDGDTDAEFLFIPNAGHDKQTHERWTDHADRWGLDATVDNVTPEYAMVALQGPDAVSLLAEHCQTPASISRFSVAYRTVAGVECLVAQTGYTGEDGVELLFDAAEAETVWSTLECQPCGLGARDTLRLEAGFLLSGQDFDSDADPRTPYEAGIGFAVDLDTAFVGRDALAELDDTGVEETLVGFRLEDRGIARRRRRPCRYRHQRDDEPDAGRRHRSRVRPDRVRRPWNRNCGRGPRLGETSPRGGTPLLRRRVIGRRAGRQSRASLPVRRWRSTRSEPPRERPVDERVHVRCRVRVLRLPGVDDHAVLVDEVHCPFRHPRRRESRPIRRVSPRRPGSSPSVYSWNSREPSSVSVPSPERRNDGASVPCDDIRLVRTAEI
jgi:aminomethyltransferase